jgi:hypothetical protein
VVGVHLNPGDGARQSQPEDGPLAPWHLGNRTIVPIK